MTLRGPTGLVAAVSALIGFHPQESLALICLRAPAVIGPIARVDLDGDGHRAPQALAEQLTGYAVRFAAATAVVCFTEQRGRPALLDATVDALERAEVPVLDVLCVRDGMIRHARTATLEQADRGVPVPPDDDPQVQALALLNAESGRVLLADRDALRASVAPPIGGALADARAAIVGVCEELTRIPIDASPIDTVLGRRARRALTRARRQLRQAGRVAAETAAELIVLAQSIPVRDSLIARTVSELDADWVPTLISVVTRCPPEESAEICCVLAVAAYRYGDGALSQVAIDRCIAAEPRHRLAHLMMSTMAAGIPPDELAELAGSDEPADHRSRDTARRRRAAG
jgi:hypothetical protein